MKSIIAALWAETLKVRKSGIFRISIIATAFFAFIMGFLFFVIKNPDLARKYALLAAKTSIAGTADWPSFLRMQYLAIGAAGFIGFGFITSWLFGREYSDRTVKDLLALPASRSSIVAAKFIVLFVWCILLSVFLFGLCYLAGTFVGLADWSIGLYTKGALTYAFCASLALLIVSPLAFFASSGRGFLPPLGFILFAMLMSQVLNVIGYGQYFPWAIPMLASGAAGPNGPQLGIANYSILICTSIAGFAGTFAWWRYADQK
jgi:ABC-2 type transport system permease protein